ncbi:MAG: tRNA (guanosine(37)-N1)-methyltransferase TrmD [Patescibacteria group bacterium]
MIYNVLTTQNNIYDSFLKTGLIARGMKKKIININIFNLYDFGLGAHKTIDDTPYGGGPGMVLRVDMIDKAITKISEGKKKKKIILLTPQGKKFNSQIAKKLAKEKELILIAGRFEGYDERIREFVDEEISIGDYVLTSGDLPTMVLIDSISRQIPKFIEKSESIQEESFEKNCLEYPQYTRPEIYKNKKVPTILLSGDHEKVRKWRQKKALEKTQKRRPDLTF